MSDEIIEEAKRRYPLGTIHYGQDGRREKKRYISTGLFYWTNGRLFCKDKNNKFVCGCIYKTAGKKWAEIISKGKINLIIKILNGNKKNNKDRISKS